jgi:hypothetical protein
MVVIQSSCSGQHLLDRQHHQGAGTGLLHVLEEIVLHVVEFERLLYLVFLAAAGVAALCATRRGCAFVT